MKVGPCIYWITLYSLGMRRHVCSEYNYSGHVCTQTHCKSIELWVGSQIDQILDGFCQSPMTSPLQTLLRFSHKTGQNLLVTSLTRCNSKLDNASDSV